MRFCCSVKFEQQEQQKLNKIAMKFKAILNRLTGLSCPVFGISWNPTESEITIATRIIRYLENKRVLFNPSEMESPTYCVKSTIQMREYLTSEMQNMNVDSKLFEYIKAMRIAARKFTDRMESKRDKNFLYNARHWDHWASWTFASALGEMRGTFGNMIAQIAAAYGLDIEDDLASIIPDSEQDNGTEK